MITISFRNTQIRVDEGNMLALAAFLVFIGASGIIVMALGFEHIGGLKPCPLCYKQRWAYYGGIPLAAVASLWAFYEKRDAAVLALTLAGAGFLLNSVFGVFHSGIEWGWWPGPSDCTGGDLSVPGGNLLQSLSQTRVVRCDEASWRFLGISFAGYNALISAGFAMIAFAGSWYGRRQDVKG